MLPREILLKMLQGNHIYPEERQQLGITRDMVLSLNDLIEVLVEELNRAGRFPSDVDEGILALREGMYLVKLQCGYECRMLRYSVHNPNVVAEAKKTLFEDPKEAAAFYMKWELGLPGRLDGITVK